MKAIDLLHRATTTTIKMVSKVGTFCIFFLFAVALAAFRAIRSQ